MSFFFFPSILLSNSPWKKKQTGALLVTSIWARGFSLFFSLTRAGIGVNWCRLKKSKAVWIQLLKRSMLKWWHFHLLVTSGAYRESIPRAGEKDQRYCFFCLVFFFFPSPGYKTLSSDESQKNSHPWKRYLIFLRRFCYWQFVYEMCSRWGVIK